MPKHLDYVEWMEWNRRQERRADLAATLVVCSLALVGLVWMVGHWL